ncbi:MAG: hypothetical protein ACREX4_23325 [Gammaproteobacteria bacterium]
MSKLATPVRPPFSPFVDNAVSTEARETAVFLFPDLARMTWLTRFTSTRAARVVEREFTGRAVSDDRTEWMCRLGERYAAALEAGQSIETSTYRHASQFLALLPATTPAPEIVVEEDGEIAFDWDLSPRQVFSVSVGRDGTLSYAGLFGIQKAHGVTMLDDDAIPSEVLAGLAKVLAH